MRIISGSARGTKLFTLEGDATRPTAERTKEAVFSMIQFCLEGRRVLDLFGGSGQLALEALSRGAAHATVCDSSRAAIDVIKRNAERTHLSDRCDIICADWKPTLDRAKRQGQRFDVVFLDPPYRAELMDNVLTSLRELLKPTSLVICESGEPLRDIPDHLEAVKVAKYGIAHVTILKLKKEDITK